MPGVRRQEDGARAVLRQRRTTQQAERGFGPRIAASSRQEGTRRIEDRPGDARTGRVAVLGSATVFR